MILWVFLENALGGSVFIFRAIYCARASRRKFDKNACDTEQVAVTISKKVLDAKNPGNLIIILKINETIFS